jgi:hypothetical protein
MVESRRSPHQTPDTVTVEISIGAIRALRPAARQRDTTVARLINDLVEVVAADGLVSAVLDDTSDASPQPVAE